MLYLNFFKLAAANGGLNAMEDGAKGSSPNDMLQEVTSSLPSLSLSFEKSVEILGNCSLLHIFFQ